MLKVRAKTVKHEDQRYPTVGDYYYDKDTLNFRISEMSNWKYEALVLIHELIEFMLVKSKGIPVDDIDKFDMEFESKRENGDVSEPGDDPHAPYHLEHQIATVVERLMASQMGVNWQDYERIVSNL